MYDEYVKIGQLLNTHYIYTHAMCNLSKTEAMEDLPLICPWQFYLIINFVEMSIDSFGESLCIEEVIASCQL